MSVLFIILQVLFFIVILLIVVFTIALFLNIKISFLYYNEIKFIKIKYAFITKVLNVKQINEILNIASSDIGYDVKDEFLDDKGVKTERKTRTKGKHKDNVKNVKGSGILKKNTEEQKINEDVNDDIKSVLNAIKNRENIHSILSILSNFKSSLQKILKRTTLKDFYLDVVINKDDPYDTAICYGKVSSYIFCSLAIAKNILNIRNEKIILDSNFVNKKHYIKSKGCFVCKPFYIIFNSVVPFIKIYKLLKKLSDFGGFLKMSKGMENLIGNAVEKLREIADANTIIGKQIDVGNNTTIIPISKVKIGIALGGSDFATKTATDNFGAGTGAGVTVTPVAFLILNNGSVTLKQLGSTDDNTTSKIIDLVPEIFDKVTGVVNNIIDDKKNKKQNEDN